MARKQAWVDDLALKAGQAGSDQILAEAGQSAETMSRDLSVVASMSVASEDPTKMVGELLGGMNLGAGISALTKRNSGIASIGSDLRKGVAGGGSASAMSLVARFQDSQNEELGTRAALIVADQARTSLAKAKKGYEQTVASANESFSSQMDSLFLGSAFVKTGSNYVRDAIVDATTAGALKEEQSVAVYKPFTSFSFEVATSLSQNDLQGLGAEGVQAQVARAMGELEAKQEEIFGAASAQNIVTTLLINGSDGKYTDSTSSTTGTRTTTVSQTRKGGPDGDPTETLVEKTETYQILTERTETQEQSPGLFGAHIGYAPIFQKNPSAEDLSKPEDMVVASGSGELGRLMMYYSYYEIKEGAGLEEYGKPSWERKMWDDRGSWLDAPSPKDVINLGVSIAASSLAPWAVMAVNLADDALFGAMDVGIGYKEADEALVDFGKTALSSALTTGLSAYGSTIMGSMGGVASATTGVVSKASGLYTIGGIDGVIARAAFTGAQSFASNVASSAVNSITYSHDAGFGYNSDSFQESVFGTSALASYASGMASSFVSGTMGLGNLTAADGHALNSQYFQTGQIASLNNLAGSLVGAGISYGMTNELTLNVLNATDLLGSKFSGGMLEMHLGGDDGFSMGLGSDGANVSASQLLAAAAGFEESKRILEWKNSTATDQKTFNAINGLGYTSNGNNWEIGRRIFTGALGVDYSSTLDGSILGQYDENRPGRITLNDDLLALDSDLGTAELASVLAHEGSHYLGNRVEGIAHLAGGQAFSELSDAWGVKDDSFSASIVEALNDASNWQENTGDVDYWKRKVRLGAGGTQEIRYEAESGDNLWSLLNAMYSSNPSLVAKVAEDNGLADPTKLQIGQELVLPGNTALERGFNELFGEFPLEATHLDLAALTELRQPIAMLGSLGDYRPTGTMGAYSPPTTGEIAGAFAQKTKNAVVASLMALPEMGIALIKDPSGTLKAIPGATYDFIWSTRDQIAMGLDPTYTIEMRTSALATASGNVLAMIIMDKMFKGSPGKASLESLKAELVAQVTKTGAVGGARLVQSVSKIPLDWFGADSAKLITEAAENGAIPKYFSRMVSERQALALQSGKTIDLSGTNGMGFIGDASELREITTSQGMKDAMDVRYNPDYLLEFKLRDTTGLQNLLKYDDPLWRYGGKTLHGYSEFNMPGLTSENIFDWRLRMLTK